MKSCDAAGLSIFIVEVKTLRDSQLIDSSVARHTRELTANRIYRSEATHSLPRGKMTPKFTKLLSCCVINDAVSVSPVNTALRIAARGMLSRFGITPAGRSGARHPRCSPAVEELAYKHNLFSRLILKIMISGLFHLFKCLT